MDRAAEPAELFRRVVGQGMRPVAGGAVPALRVTRVDPLVALRDE